MSEFLSFCWAYIGYPKRVAIDMSKKDGTVQIWYSDVLEAAY